MDGMPVSDRLLFWVQKKPEPLNVAAVLVQHVQDMWGSAAAQAVASELRELSQLRPLLRQKDAVTSQTIRTQLHYCELLTHLSMHLPLADGKVNVEFTWHDHYSHKKATSSLLGFEVCCALFNAAVVHGGLGCAAERTEVGLLRAREHFQRAAAMLEHIRQRLLQEGVLCVTPDMSPVGLAALAQLATAQALHMHYLLEVLRGHEDRLLEQRAMDVALEYVTALNQLGHPVLSPLKDKDFQVVCQQVRLYCILFEVRAGMHIAMQCQTAGQWGDALAHLLHSREQLRSKEARGLAKVLPSRLATPALVLAFEAKLDIAVQKAALRNALAGQPVPQLDGELVMRRSAFQLPVVPMPELQLTRHRDPFASLPRLKTIQIVVGHHHQALTVAIARAHESLDMASHIAGERAAELIAVAQALCGNGPTACLSPQLLSRVAALQHQASPDCCTSFLTGLATSAHHRISQSASGSLSTRLTAALEQLHASQTSLTLLDGPSTPSNPPTPHCSKVLAEVQVLPSVVEAGSQAATMKLVEVSKQLLETDVGPRFAGVPSAAHVSVLGQLETEVRTALAHPEMTFKSQVAQAIAQAEETIQMSSAQSDIPRPSAQKWAYAVDLYEQLIAEFQELHALAGDTDVSLAEGRRVDPRRSSQGTLAQPLPLATPREMKGLTEDVHCGLMRHKSQEKLTYHLLPHEKAEAHLIYSMLDEETVVHRVSGDRSDLQGVAMENGHSSAGAKHWSNASLLEITTTGDSSKVPSDSFVVCANATARRTVLQPASPSPDPSTDGLSDTDAEAEKGNDGPSAAMDDPADAATIPAVPSVQEMGPCSSFDDLSAATVYVERLSGVPKMDLSHITDDQMEEVEKLEYDNQTQEWHSTQMRCYISPDPFAEGNLRVCHRMVGIEEGAERCLYVAKYSRDPDEAESTYLADVQTQEFCRLFAESYNDFSPPKPVQFLRSFLIKRDPTSLGDNGLPALFHVEPFLPGEYIKHNNNWGFVEDDEAERNTPQAFSHFTYVVSGGQYLVVDIQGVGDVYTDPQIHSADGIGFGLGNCGMEGVEKFFESHQCNPLCRYLGLPLHQPKSKDSGTQAPQLISPKLARLGSIDSLAFSPISAFSTPEKPVPNAFGSPFNLHLVGSPHPSPPAKGMAPIAAKADGVGSSKPGCLVQAKVSTPSSQNKLLSESGAQFFFTPPRNNNAQVNDCRKSAGDSSEFSSPGCPARPLSSGLRPVSIPEWRRLGIPQAQYGRAFAIFTQLDPQGTGRIPKQLLLPSMRRLRLHVSLQQARDAMRIVKGPEMTFEQFAGWWTGVEPTDH